MKYYHNGFIKDLVKKMEPFYQYIEDYKQQITTGTVQKVYRGLLEYILALKTHFSAKHPDYFVPGSLYFGYMDMTYFSLNPLSFRHRKLRVALVFIHRSCEFQAWLAGYNKQVQSEYWNLFKQSGWNKYPLVDNIKGVDSIIEVTLEKHPDFSDLDALTDHIVLSAEKFIDDIGTFLSTHPLESL